MPRKTLFERLNIFIMYITGLIRRYGIRVLWIGFGILLLTPCQANSRHPIQIAQFVLMQNHYHMLVRTPNGNLDKFMYEFGKNFSLAFVSRHI